MFVFERLLVEMKIESPTVNILESGTVKVFEVEVIAAFCDTELIMQFAAVIELNSFGYDDEEKAPIISLSFIVDPTEE